MVQTPAPESAVQAMSEPRLLFVYGTLMRGERNHPYLVGAEFLGEVATSSGFRLLDLERYPGMVKAPERDGRPVPESVQGELFRVTPEQLEAIDELEGHPHHFWRTNIELVDRRRAAAYLLTSSYARGAPRIESGDWHRR